jgi:arsenate reductase-like glutaredoxin family protein
MQASVQPKLGRHVELWLAVTLLMGCLGTASAQQVYRVVAPDGTISYSDKPPAQPDVKAATMLTGRAATNAAGVGLPYDIRVIANRYPVTLYTGSNCSPCASARSLLTQRGIPFTEKTVSTNADIEALVQLAGESSVPFGTIGTQQLKGYSESQWTQYLDAADYPATNKLPSAYRNPAPTPLTTPAKPGDVASADGKDGEGKDGATEGTSRRSGTNVRTRPVRTEIPAPVDRAANPAGIKF